MGTCCNTADKDIGECEVVGGKPGTVQNKNG